MDVTLINGYSGRSVYTSACVLLQSPFFSGFGQIGSLFWPIVKKPELVQSIYHTLLSQVERYKPSLNTVGRKIVHNLQKPTHIHTDGL